MHLYYHRLKRHMANSGTACNITSSWIGLCNSDASFAEARMAAGFLHDLQLLRLLRRQRHRTAAMLTNLVKMPCPAVIVSVPSFTLQMFTGCLTVYFQCDLTGN